MSISLPVNTPPRLESRIRKYRRFALHPALRLAVYLVYFLLVYYQIDSSQVFPFRDGMSYYTKAAWMAQQPIERAFSREAFEFIAYRPPAPMWMTLPVMLIYPTFKAFALTLCFWQLLFIEVGVLAAFSRRMLHLRNPVAIALCFGAGSRLMPQLLYFVDSLLYGQVIAAMGLTFSWFRSPRPSKLAGVGVCLGIALLTKPAALLIIPCLIAGVVTGMALRFWLMRKDARASHALVSFSLHAVALFIPLLLALTCYFGTSYYTTMRDFRGVMSLGLSTSEMLLQAIRPQTLAYSLRLMTDNTGPILALALPLLLLAGLWKNRWRKLHLATLTCGIVAAGGILAYAFIVPLKDVRYYEPGIAVIILLTALAVQHQTRLQKLFFGAAIASTVWWLPFVHTSFPGASYVTLNDAGRFKNLRRFARDIGKLIDRRGDQPANILCTVPGEEADTLAAVSMFRYFGFDQAARHMKLKSPYVATSPIWPFYKANTSITLATADIVVCEPPEIIDVLGKEYRDWDTINNALWDQAAAIAIDLREFKRTERFVIYETVSSTSPLETAKKRAYYLQSLPLNSDGAKEARRYLETLLAVQQLTPGNRKLVLGIEQNRFGAIFMDYEHPGSQAPSKAKVLLGPGQGLKVTSPYPPDETWRPNATISYMDANGEQHIKSLQPSNSGQELMLPALLDSRTSTTVTIELLPSPEGHDDHGAGWVSIATGT